MFQIACAYTLQALPTSSAKDNRNNYESRGSSRVCAYHDVQEEVPVLAAVVPAGQGEHAVAPTTAVYFPTVQLLHATLRVTALYLPDAQPVQTAVPEEPA